MTSTDQPADADDQGATGEPGPSPDRDFVLLWDVELDDCPPATTFDPMDQR